MNVLHWKIFMLCTFSFTMTYADEEYLDDNSDDNSHICLLKPLWTGTDNLCKEKLVKYTYDVKGKKCVQFIYGGCLGTANLFNTIEECTDVCSNLSTQADTLKEKDDDRYEENQWDEVGFETFEPHVPWLPKHFYSN